MNEWLEYFKERWAEEHKSTELMLSDEEISKIIAESMTISEAIKKVIKVIKEKRVIFLAI